MSVEGSSQVLDPAFAQLLHRTFGKPTFLDKSTSKMGKYLKELGVEIPGQGGRFA